MELRETPESTPKVDNEQNLNDEPQLAAENVAEISDEPKAVVPEAEKLAEEEVKEPVAEEKVEEPVAVSDDSEEPAGTEAAEENDNTANSPAEETARKLSKEEVIANLALLADKPAAEIAREEVARLRQLFHQFRKAEIEEEKKAFLERGNEESAFAVAPNADEEKVNELLAQIREKKAELAAAIEDKRKEALEAKNRIIDEIDTLAADTDNVNRHFRRVKELQQEYNAIGEVTASEATRQWKRYNEAVENFYDQYKMNKELRDYDFKKNLEQKTAFCEEAEKLIAEEDVVAAFRSLQNLHNKWREIGPVAKEHREAIWNRFKEASAGINKRYQDFFEKRKEHDQEIEKAKVAICEKAEALNFDNLRSRSEWAAMTKAILDLQEEWKNAGSAYQFIL